MDPFKKRNPVEEWRRLKRSTIYRLHRRGIPLNRQDREICRLKNSHVGKRAFVIGNGPSLRVSDLELLRNEITFGSNKVYLAFDQTAWRPTYYSVSDRLVAKNNAAKIRTLDLRKILSDEVKEYFPDVTDVLWFHELFGTGDFSQNLLLGSCAGATIIYHQLQIAFYMGITEVYILGADFSFNVPAAKVATNVPGYTVALESKGESNHFHPDYRKPGEIWGVPDLDEQLRSFTKAKEVYESAGRKIINSSRQTKLEVFSRVPLETVLGLPERPIPSATSP